MRFAVAIGVVVALATFGWAIRYDVASEVHVRAVVSAPGAARRALPTGRGELHLISVLEEESDAARRCAAAELLARATSTEASRALLRALGDPDPAVQAAAARCVGAHAQRIEAILGGLREEEVLGILRACPVTHSLTWLYDLALRAQPGLGEAASRAVLPRLGPSQVRTIATQIELAVRAPSVRSGPMPRGPLSERERERVLACLRGGLESPHETVRALFAVEIAERGGPEPTDEQVRTLLDGFRNDAEFHHFFLAAARRDSQQLESWVRMIVSGDRALGVYWTLLGVDRALGHERTAALAREGLSNPEESVRAQCQKWLDQYGPKDR